MGPVVQVWPQANHVVVARSSVGLDGDVERFECDLDCLVDVAVADVGLRQARQQPTPDLVSLVKLGQNLFKCSPTVNCPIEPKVSMRAGHDPAVAAKHYTGRVQQSDRDLADAIGSLLDGLNGSRPDVGEDNSEFSRSFLAPQVGRREP